MGLVIKSDSLYKGASTLPSLSSLQVTSAIYQARVLADGGEIIDSAAVDSAFAFLVAQGVSTNQFVVGASFGIRRDGNDVMKLYSFDGNDMTLLTNGDAGWYPRYDSTSYALPVVTSTHPTATLNNFRAQSLMRIQVGDGYCFAMAVRDDGSDGNIPTFQAYYPNGVNVAPAGFEVYNGAADGSATPLIYAYAPKAAYTTGALQGATVACVRSNATGYVAWDGLCMHARQTTGVVKVYQNGVLADTATDAAGLLNMRDQQVYLAFGYKQHSGVTASNRNHQFGELWQVKDCSEAFALALSSRLGTLY